MADGLLHLRPILQLVLAQADVLLAGRNPQKNLHPPPSGGYPALLRAQLHRFLMRHVVMADDKDDAFPIPRRTFTPSSAGRLARRLRMRVSVTSTTGVAGSAMSPGFSARRVTMPVSGERSAA